MEELTLQVKLLENEIDVQVQQGFLDRRQDLYELFASDDFSCTIDWNAIHSKKLSVSSGNITYDGHNEITQRMKFMYKESDNPDEFFLPYIWSTLVSM
jgi:hypothetical protein